MHGGQKCASELGEDFAWGAKTCLRFGGRFCTGCINVPQIWGKILHGVHKRASDLGEDFAWGAKTCLSFGRRFCTGCINVPQIWGRLLHGVHKRLPVLRQVYEVSGRFSRI